ncbi:MMPL family transporter [Jeongeupia chitinilytica]|uniref:Membrane protein n=1 Tax=Jeongeupia chitinilytica TaxID=1041641 RepID=A0ABQ3H5U3_9NEIS|nr:MMPL family transporter [Jeongeupia chitinilytica]GHD69028.1 membrane protein [Jeongeupia chitinilytica]
MTESRLWRALALAWLIVLLGCAGWLASQHRQLANRLDTDLFALLPKNERDPVAERAMASLAQASERQLVLLVGSADRDAAARAADTLAGSLKALPVAPQTQALDLDTLRDFYAPYRGVLFTPADAAALAQGRSAWQARALQQAYATVSTSGLAWRDDPFGTFGRWLQGFGDLTRVRPEGGRLWVDFEERHYVVLMYTLADSAFSLSAQKTVADGLDHAITGLKAGSPDVSVLRAGVVLHAAKAAQRAEHEMSTIGIGSLAGILLLVLLTFRGWRALPLVALSIATGMTIALALTFALYGRVHMLTLVFGTSLIGVAVDYSLLLHSTSLGASVAAGKRLETLLPSLLVATLFTALAYLCLALTPFPGLAQMAVFAATGIASAWLSELFWYPRLAPARLEPGVLGGPLLKLLARWPRLGLRGGLVVLVVAAPLIVTGLLKLDASDDVRSLVSTDATLMREQIAIGQRLGLPSPAQLFIVSGPDAQTVLERERTLTRELDGFVARGAIAGYQSVSRWLPPVSEQRAQQAGAAVLRDPALLHSLADDIGLDDAWVRAQSAATPLLEPDVWLASPASLPARHLWLGNTGHGYASVVMLTGLAGAANTAALSKVDLPGVRWIDKPAEISAVLDRYRDRLALVLLAAYVVTAALLWRRYRRDTWRVLAPSLIASIATLAIFGWLGIPLQLLTVLTLLLLLGMGIDYGIFVNEHPGEVRMVLAISLAACCTLLSFGLLAFSHTPALATFGTATLSGVGLAWLTAPLLRRPALPQPLFQTAPQPDHSSSDQAS